MTELPQTNLQADALIDSFGGIRPMASKTGIPVTTVQGWKKRGAIPASRLGQIQEAARSHGIVLNALPVVVTAQDFSDAPDTVEDARETTSDAANKDAPAPAAPVANADKADLPPKSNRLARVSWAALMILAVAVLIGLLAMAPGVSRLMVQEQRLGALERELLQMNDQVRRLRQQNALLAGVVPDEVKNQMRLLAERAQAIEETVGDLGRETRALTQGVMGGADGTIEQRLSKIEGQMDQAAAAQDGTRVISFLTRLEEAQRSQAGRKSLSRAAQQVMTAIAGAPDLDAMSARLSKSAKTTPELAQIFEGLTAPQMRAPILLFALMDLRQKLDRGELAFDQNIQLFDLLLLQGGGEELAGDRDRLRASAKTGVMTLPALLAAFDRQVPEIVAASLAEKDVSALERMRARLHSVFRVERRGEPLTGTRTQKTIDAARKKLAGGDVAAALTALQALDGKAAARAAPWSAKAEQTLAARSLLERLTRVISAQISVEPFPEGLPALRGGGAGVDAIVQGLVQSLASAPELARSF